MGHILAIFVFFAFQFSQAGEFLVRMRDYPMGLTDFTAKLEEQGLQVMTVYELVPGLMRIKGDESALVFLQQNPDTLYIEHNNARVPSILQKPTIPFAERPSIPAKTYPPTEWVKSSKDTQNYGLYQSRTKEIFEKRKFYGSDKVVIAVLDTGVDYTHRDLAANMWRNPGESGFDNSGRPRESNGLDDDNNGFIDDVVGWDFVHKDGLPYDDYGHGTHVAGISAAVGGDGWGMSGHCPRCSIMALKFITSNGWGSDADAIEGLEYAAKMGATIINSSWGGTEFGQALYDAFAATSKMGIINTVAAGNMGVNLGMESPNQYPAEFQLPGLYTAAALYEVHNFIPFWSNYGTPYVHFSCAGDDVYSAIPGNKHAPMSGTSMAAPGGAGMIGLMKSFRPNLTFAQITSTLKNAKIPDKDSMSKTVFGGRPDMVKAFNLLDSLPE